MGRIVFAILWLLASTCVCAQAVETETFSYVREDLLAHQEHRGVWVFRQTEGENVVKAEKKMSSSLLETEDTTYWERVSALPDLNLEVHEHFGWPLEWMEENEKGIGWVDTIDSKTHELIESWPMFYIVKAVEPVVHIEFTILMGSEGTYTIVREFNKGEFEAPLIEHRKVTSAQGEVVSDVIDLRQP